METKSDITEKEWYDLMPDDRKRAEKANDPKSLSKTFSILNNIVYIINWIAIIASVITGIVASRGGRDAEYILVGVLCAIVLYISASFIYNGGKLLVAIFDKIHSSEKS